MRRSRAVVAASVAVMTVGSALALGAWYVDPARAAVGPLPAEGLALPAETRFLMGLDVKRLVASPFYQRMSVAERPDALRDVEEKTGLNPERDIDLVVMAGADSAPDGGGLVLVKGGFDRYRVARAIEKQGKNVTWQQHEGGTVYVYREGRRGSKAIAFLSDDAFVLGDAADVTALLSRRAEGQAPLRANQTLMGLLDDVTPGSAFWVVGDQTALSHLPKTVPGGTGGAKIPLPGLRTVVMSGELDPVIALDVRGAAEDEKAARNLGDLVNGFVALARLQSQNRPELGQLVEGVSVTTEGNRVRVSARVPYEALEALKRAKGAGREGPAAAR